MSDVQGVKFNLEVNNVLRDFSQGLYANRIPLDDLKALEIFKLWNSLVLSSANNQTRFSAIEMGGAQPQVDSIFLGKDFTETFRQVRNAAPNSPIRPLWRGANGVVLQAQPVEVLGFMLEQMAEDTKGEGLENLRVKAFDSQAVLKELESSIAKVAELRNRKYKVSVEVAIPYSNGEKIDPLHPEFNPYIDEFFVERIVSAAKLAQKYNLSPDAFRISLKDMVGELTSENATRLVGKIVDRLQAENLNYTLGLHLHDTGLAADAYVAAIKVCNEKNWPIAIDTVEGKDTGFASTILVHEKLKAVGIESGLTEEQIAVLNQMANLTNSLSEDYKLARVGVGLGGDKLRQFRIPGGGYASFVAAVKQRNIAGLLGVSDDGAVLIAGNALIQVGRLMGYPFAVTPGFQNKQIAALNLLSNMIEAGFINKEMTKDAIIKNVISSLSDEQVEKLFLRNLGKVVEEFLRGEMPANDKVHPVVRAKLGIREGLLTDGLKSDLPAAQKIVRELKDEGYLQNKSENAAGCWALIVGAGNFRERVTKPWLHEPYANEHKSAQEYQRAKAKYQQGLNPNADKVDKVRIALSSGVINQDFAEVIADSLFSEERASIRASVLAYMNDNANHISALVTGIKHRTNGQHYDDILSAVVSDLGVIQNARYKESIANGYQPLYSASQRAEMALSYLAEELVKLTDKELATSDKNAIKDALIKIHRDQEKAQSEVKSGMNGKIISVKVNVGDQVKEGDALFILEAMKMQIEVKARRAGKIESIALKAGDDVREGAVILSYEKSHLASETKSVKDIPVAVNEEVAGKISARKEKVAQELTLAKGKLEEAERALSTLEGTQSLQKSGLAYNRRSLSKGQVGFTLRADRAIHVIGNRAGCAAKIKGDLEQFGADVRLMHTDSDKTTPVVQSCAESKRIKINSYTDHEEIIAELKKISEANAGRQIFFHPGWGFLSEKDEFVRKMEEQIPNVIFAGPPSEPMKVAGGKLSFRDTLNSTEEGRKYNPKYFGNDKSITAADLKRYIDSNFNSSDTVDKIYRTHFAKLQEMGGDVVIKAVDGGGGKGIKFFKTDLKKTDEENYMDYVKAVHENMAYSERQFGNGQVLTESRIRGNTRHLEVQFAASAAGAITLGFRDCTAQNDGQKFVELNVIKGDFSSELLANIQRSSLAIANSLKEKGYRGVGTLEMLVVPEKEEVCILEVNTRMQVEHMVTESDIAAKTGKEISIPVFISELTKPGQNLTPEQILANVFGFTVEDMAKFNKFGEERIMHVRINAKNPDFVAGKTVPTGFADHMWPASWSEEIAKATGVNIIHGGKGGNYDSQVGAICGTREQVVKALKMLGERVALSEAFDRSYNATNISFVLSAATDGVVFDKKGSIRQGFSTSTIDKLLEGIADGKVTLGFGDFEESTYPGRSPVKSEALSRETNELANQRLMSMVVLSSSSSMRGLS